MTKTVCVKNADWVVAWDASSRRHAYLEHGDVVFAGDTLTFVGRDYPGRADETIDGRGLMVMPGLIDVHSHPCLEASYRGIREEHGVPEMYMSGLFERAGAYWPDDEGKLACAEAAYCELLRSGVTTLVDISGDYPGWVDLIARSGLRGVLAPSYASSRWVVRRSHLLEYEWNEAAGRQAFEEALRLCDDLAKHPERAAVRHDLARADRHLHRGSAARQRRGRARARAALHRALRPGGGRVPRDGAPPRHHARSSGRTRSACPGPAPSSATPCSSTSTRGCTGGRGRTSRSWPTPAPRSRTARRRSPATARRSSTSASIASAGVNLGIGTDTVPQNLIEEMRWATVLARIAAEDIRIDRDGRRLPRRHRGRRARASCARISAGSPPAPRRISCSWT